MAPRTSPQLVFDAVETLIAGRKIRGELPSHADLERTAAVSRETVSAVIGMLRDRGYVEKQPNGRYVISTPESLQSTEILGRVDDLERSAVAMRVTFDDIVALLASRMLVHGDWAEDRAEKLALIETAVETYRSRERRAPKKTSNRGPTKREQAEAVREELEGLHRSGGSA